MRSSLACAFAVLLAVPAVAQDVPVQNYVFWLSHTICLYLPTQTHYSRDGEHGSREHHPRTGTDLSKIPSFPSGVVCVSPPPWRQNRERF
jgi:hypothetical protein